MYQRQPNSFPEMSSHHITRPNPRNKENIPMNPQSLHKSQTIPIPSHSLKDNSSSLHTHSYHISHPLKPRENRDNYMRECTSAGVRRRKESFDLKHDGHRGLEPEARELNVSLLDMEKDGATTQREVREEKEILINEFKSIGEKLKKMRELDKESHTRRNSLSRTDRLHEDNYKKLGSHENSQVFHNEILCKLDELNHKYQKLAKNITNYPHSYAEERTSYNSKSTMKDTESASSNRFEDMRFSKHPDYNRVEQIRDKLYRNETKRTFPEASTEGESDFAREEFEREKEEFARKKAEAETELETRKKQLQEYEAELTRRDTDITERTKVLEANEKEFEELTERLERQSEELTNQKMEYNKKVEAFHSRVEAFEQEKEEFLKYENEFNMKNIELRSDQEHLKAFQEKLKVEHELLEERCKNLVSEYDEFNRKRRELDLREEYIKAAEDDFEGKVEKYREDAEALNIERQEFIKLVDLAETRLREREEELAEREQLLNVRKEKYDDFDLKLLGMRLNEEVWQKKRDIEVGALQVEINKIREKEKELRKREEKLKKIEGRLENEERSTMGRTGTHTDLSVNDKSLLPMSSRTSKTETEGRDTIDN